ncbi:hypothetical protein MMC16_007365 [Acarospora aff. strigata]|nr:hypothetical protein [Acarospora aff. strigata]
MGNQQSDQGEQEAWKVIGHVPLVNFFYGGIRAAVYASKNNMAEAHSGALAMIPFAHNIIHGVIPAATRKAIEHAENFLRQKEDQLRQEYWMVAGAWDIFKASGQFWQTWRDREWQGRLRTLMQNGAGLRWGRGLR